MTSTVKRARNARWLIVYLTGIQPVDIALSEMPPVSESTVWRGIKQARTLMGTEMVLTDEEPEVGRVERATRNAKRRRTKPVHSWDY